MLSWLTGAGSVMKSIEAISKEYIDTEKETAEAKALFVKTLDPNGLMRRDISGKIIGAYLFYLGIMVLLLVLEFFGYGEPNITQKLTELFLPVNTMTLLIVGASFGVNGINSFKGK